MEQSPDAGPLPWERIDGPPAGDGICLSGGGLRAASFAFGVLQMLQERRRLMYGTECAHYLAAVSGGSYIAATYLLGSHHQALHPGEYRALPPLAEGSPEEAHILSHGGYLAERPLRFVGFALLNLLALVVLFVWAGTMLADLALVHTFLRTNFGAWFGVLAILDRIPTLALSVVLLAAWFAFLSSNYAEPFLHRLMVFPSAIGLVATCQPVLRAAAAHEHWWTVGRFFGVVAAFVVVLVVVAGAVLLAQRLAVVGLAARGLNTIAAFTPRGLNLIVLAWSAVWWHRLLTSVLAADDDDLATLMKGIGAFFGSLLAGALFSAVSNRASLHREYRCRLQSCFAVRRVGGVVDPIGDIPLSDLAPPGDGPARFPRLLICATANVRLRIPGRGRLTFVPFVLTHDRCGAPGYPGAAFPTAQLQLGREPAGVFTRSTEPLVSLFTAVAVTGAAIAPSMGRFTLPTLRPLLVVLNLRLGRWFPNPFWARARRAVQGMTAPGHFGRGRGAARAGYVEGRFGPGYDELIPDLLGLDGPRVYVSDGGHYDNLGLLALLRAKCTVLWCVDASPEPTGRADEIRRVLAIAREELDIDVDIDLDRFAAESDGLYRETHAIGRVHYPDGSTGRLVTVKLGLARASPQELRRRRRQDRGFPHHNTLRQVYGPDRMDAYRQLGRDVTSRCLDEYDTDSPQVVG